MLERERLHLPSQKSQFFDREAVDRSTMISDGIRIQAGRLFPSRIFLRCSSTVLKATLPKFTPIKRHPAGRNIYEVEVESANEEESESPCAIIDVDASRAECTRWRDSRLSRRVLLACQVQRLIVRSVGCRSCVQSVCSCAMARQQFYSSRSGTLS